MQALKVYIINRKTRLLRDVFDCFTYTINNDYLNNAISTFTSKDIASVYNNDFIVADFKNKNNNIEIDGVGIVSKPLYIGVVSSYEDDTINANMFFNIANTDIPVINHTADKSTVDNLIINLLADTSKSLGAIIYNNTIESDLIYSSTFFSYNNENTLTTTTLKDYLLEVFKKTNMSWVVDYVKVNNSNLFEINTSCRGFKKNAFQIKNNNTDFINWEYYNESDKNNSFNCLKIIDSNNKSMVSPTVLATYYMNILGDITQDSLINVTLPTRTKLYLLDTSSTDNPSYLEIAKSELTPPNFNHEINFDLKSSSKILNITDLKIGDVGTIIYNNEVINSVYTGFVINSDSDFINLKFGQNRADLTSAFKKLETNILQK